ncbi:MAG: hypothetical protein U0235_10850 [Polyangiaceae bacterium]
MAEPSRTLREGVVPAWGRRGTVALATEVARAVEALGVSPDTPWSKLADEDRRAILFGSSGKADGGAEKGEAAATKSTKAKGAKKKKPYVGIVQRLEARLEGADGDGDDDASDSDDPDASEGAVADDQPGSPSSRAPAAPATAGASAPKRSRSSSRARTSRTWVERRSVRCEPSSTSSDVPDQVFGARDRAIAEPPPRGGLAARLPHRRGLDYLTPDRSADALER